MQLRAIETVGFKSFADKIELNFVDGITAIVGPNGSGKSNVSDAIRWVLGEQSMRNLRGSSMEDVIFSGSSKRKALNIAEVTLVFNNASGMLPVDYEEVTVSRRLFRSGDSSYFINKTPCRLKDIHELFADTGLGKGSLCIIGQNKVDEILNGRAEDRRSVFEEAAGIVKHKLRKREALRRLEETENNIVRLNDIRLDIADRLEPMRESAERTKKHNEYQTELKSCRVTQMVRKTDNAENMLKTAGAQVDELKESEATLEADLTIKENKIFMLSNQIEQMNADLSAAQQSVSEKSALIEKLTGQRAVLSERIKQNKERISSVKADIERLEEDERLFTDESDEFNRRLDEQKANEMEAEEDKLKFDAELEKIDEQINSLQELIEKEQTDILERKRSIMQIGNDIRSYETELASNERKAQKHTDEKKEIEDKIAVIKGEIDTYNAGIASFSGKKDALLKEGNVLEDGIKGCDAELQIIAKDEKTSTEKMVSLQSKVNVLEKMQSDFEGFSYSVKKLMSAKHVWRKDIVGTVGQLIEVPDDLVFAVETALGAAVQNIVTMDDKTAKFAIEFLKAEKAGRATFLPLNRLRTFDEKPFTDAPGIIGAADKLIKYDGKVAPAVKFLLGRTLIAENLDSALKASKKDNNRYRIVTLDGDVIHASGSMSGGSRTGKEAGFLSRKKEIAVAKEEITGLQGKIAEIAKHKESIGTKKENYKEDISNLKEQIKQLELEYAAIMAHLSESEKAFKEVTLSLDTVNFEYNDVLKQNAEIKVLLDKLSKDKKVAEFNDEKKQVESEDCKKQLETVREAKVDIESAGNDANMRYQAAKTATEILLEQYENISSRGSKLSDERARLEKELGVFASNIDTAVEESKQLEMQITESKRALQDSKAHLDQLVARQMELLPEQKDLEKVVKELRSELNGVQNKLRNADSIFVRYETELAMQLEQLKENYQLTIEEARSLAKKELSDRELSGKIGWLEEHIEELGPVNPAAIEEYEELKNRYDFMMQQYTDLVKAKEDLDILLRDIDNIMTRRFREAFNAINQHFGETFARLFGGGTAELKLTEPADVLSSGIDIIVQPPGKKQQTLSLLSGGERALTVIALLFAMLSYRPAPFCVLDEVDAALDEVNVDRFVNFVVDYAQKTQFVVITHRKATMQAANVLHGITMEETGVSKLVSLKMGDRKEETA